MQVMERFLLPAACCAAVVFGLLLGGRNALAQLAAAPGKLLISDVDISGNLRLTKEQIKVRLSTKVGEEYNPAKVDEDVRELYKTGQFSNIRTWQQQDGIDHVKVYFSVREMPNMVQKVTYLGAKHIKQDELQNITGVRTNTPLNHNLNRQGCQKILEHYAEMGRSFAECQLIKGGDVADTEVIYQITEGPKVKVRDIQFAGKTFTSAARLRQKIPLHVGGTYKRKAAEASIDELSAFFRAFGFQDVRIALETKRDSVPGEVTLIYHIHEGPRSRSHSSEPRP